MKKRFVAHKKSHFRLIKIILWVIIIIISFISFFNILLKYSLSNVINNTKNQITIVSSGLNSPNFLNFNLLNPEEIFQISLNYLLNGHTSTLSDNLTVIKESENDENPIIYIYNTHQTEEYDSSLLDAYNISYTVMTGSLILKEYLNDLGIPCYVENESMSDYLKSNNLLYKNSYEASRYYILKRKEEMPSIKYYIDVHRDSALKSATTTLIDGKSYAKVLFVVGMDHTGYEANLSLAEKLNQMLDANLTRGISKKTGSKVNGIYNQDISENAILLEIGGVDNSIMEVNNTLKVIADTLLKIIEEEQNG